ncbi:MAG: hypothetical protein K1060chlam2_00745 [Chlamydiae bacterium]|nr:hypothetical protein [Chlamydiota bacterium]
MMERNNYLNDMVRRKKFVLLGIFLSLLLAFVLFHHSLICFGARSYLSGRLPKGGMLTFEYASLRYSAGQFILHDVSINRADRVGSLTFHIKVEDLKVDFDIGLTPLRFKPNVVFDHPQVALHSGELRAVKRKKTLYQLLNKHLFKSPITIHQGELHFEDQLIFLSFENPEAERAGRIELSKGADEEPVFSATFSKEERDLHFEMTFDSFDVAWAFKMGRTFFPALSSELNVHDGSVSGELSFVLSEPYRINDLKSSLDLSDFSLSHEKYGLKFGVQKFRWREEAPSSGALVERVWPYLVGSGELEGVEVTVEDSIAETLWTVSDARGALCFSKESEPLIQLEGTFTRDGKEFPLEITGEAFIEEETLWKAAVDLKVLASEEPSTQAYIALTSKGDQKYLVQTEFSHVNRELLGLLQHLSAVQFPMVREVVIDGGVFGGKMQGWVEGREIKRCEVVHFHSEDLNIALPAKRVRWSAQRVEGKGEFDFSSPDFFDGSCWELNVAKGCIGAEEGLQVDHLDLHLAMHDQYIKPSKLECRLGRIRGRALFEGLYTHLNLNVDLDLSPEELSRLLGHEFKEKIALDLDLHLKTLQEQISVEGVVGFLHGEEERDTIQFGWNWNLLELWKGNFQAALDLGWFNATDLSDRTMNLPLIFWKQSWRGEGRAHVEGTFNSKAVEFTLDPTELSFISPSLDIAPNLRGTEKAPNCIFNFDFHERIWHGKIPLKDARVKEHSFGIEFDTFTSEVDLVHSKLLFHNVEASADGLNFQAEVALDFHMQDRNELTIETQQIDGKAEDVLAFLRHFGPFKNFNFPLLEGSIESGPGEMRLSAYVGGVEELLEWRIALHFQEGQIPFSEALVFENLAGDLFYSAKDEFFKIQKTEGQLLLSAGNDLKSYELNIPLLELDAARCSWNFDARLEAPTHDICRIAGTALNREGELNITLDHDLTRLFGAKIDLSKLSFTDESLLSRVNAKINLSSLDLFQTLDFLSSAGLIPIKPVYINELRTTKFEGETAISFLFDRGEELLVFDAKSDHLLCGPLDLDHLAIHAERRGDHITLDHFEADSFSMRATMERSYDEWSIPQFEIAWRACHLKGGEGLFDEESKRLSLPLDSLSVNLEELSTLFPPSEIDWSYLSGELSARGELTFDFSGGVRDLSFDSTIKVVGENFGRGGVRLESSESLHLSYDREQGFLLKEANFNFQHPGSSEHWAKCHFDALSYQNQEWRGENFRLIVPPEMIHFLGKTHSLPHLSYEDDSLILIGHPLRWDNQIEATMDFTIGREASAKGRLKEGYYWIGEKSWYLNDFDFSYEKAAFDLKLTTLFDEMPFDLKAHLSFLPHLTTRIVVQESSSGQQESEDPLVIKTTWSEQEGFYIRSLEGRVCGLDFDFHHNPKESFLDRAVLTGQLKLDLPALGRLLPDNVQESIREFGIGEGYVLSGDLTLSKVKLEESFFEGYLKGKNFQLMGSTMETLMSEITIYSDQIELSHFNISDASGIFTMEEIEIKQSLDERWSLVIPELAIQDFRPSLLNKIGKYPGPIKPLTIRTLKFHNIRGYLGDAKSFSGKGKMKFINTFKRDYNLLDIPLEILGRLGLDMGLLVPVRGNLKFIMVDGRIYLTELTKSYSEGKRSQFFLSVKQPSYIDFDGNINVNIKMKQYVLLKLTEPFTLSIAGTFENPKYGLK